MARCCKCERTNDPKISFHKGETYKVILTKKKLKKKKQKEQTRLQAQS